jgi:hypothetical protein
MKQRKVHENLGDLKKKSDCFDAIEQQLHSLERFSTPAEIDVLLVQIRAQLRSLQRKIDHGESQPL